MSISSLSASPYVPVSTGQPSSANGASGSAPGAASIGDQLLAALAQSQSANGVSSDPLLQELVSLSPAAQGQATAAIPQTYNAQGLLQQMQNNMLLNDPLLQSDTSATNGTMNDPLLQSPMALPQLPVPAAPAVGAGSGAALPAGSAPNGGTATANAQTQAAAATAPGANWAQLLQQDPSLAATFVETQIDQGVISMLGQ